MTPGAILALVLQYGPSIIPLIAQLTAWIRDNKKEVTAEDFALLARYASTTADDYLREAGIVRPPTQ